MQMAHVALQGPKEDHFHRVPSILLGPQSLALHCTLPQRVSLNGAVSVTAISQLVAHLTTWGRKEGIWKNPDFSPSIVCHR